MAVTCKVLPNRYKKHYVANASAPLGPRMSAANRYVDLAYGDFIERQPDGYKWRPGAPVREPYFPLPEEYEWLERIADYILADDLAEGLMIMRDPYDNPRNEDVWTPPGEGAAEYIRSRQAVIDAVPYVATNFGQLKADAYANTDFTAIEYLVDFEASAKQGNTSELAALASSYRRIHIESEGGPGTKICVICDLPFIDKSRSKRADVCGRSCARRRHTLAVRGYRYGTTELEGERNRQHLEYPFYSPAEMRILETRSESAYGDTNKISAMSAAKDRKQKHGVNNTVTLVNRRGSTGKLGLDGVYAWGSRRNDYKFDSWERNFRWGPVLSYNVNERPLTEKFVDSRGLSERACPWLDTCHISA